MPFLPSSAAAVPLPPHLARQIWRGDQLGSTSRGSVPTGHAALDANLPGGGWPLAALSEVLSTRAGIGEMRLLAPALRAITTDRWQPRHAVFVAPPHVPYAPALAAWGVALERVVWVAAQEADAPWAAEQALKNAGVGVVLMWLPKARIEVLRRLQLAAYEGNALAFLMRPAAALAQSSPAPLRLKCVAVGNRDTHFTPCLAVEIVKRRGGPALGGPIRLSVPLGAPAWSPARSPALPCAEPAIPAIPVPAVWPLDPGLEPRDVMDRRRIAVVAA